MSFERGSYDCGIYCSKPAIWMLKLLHLSKYVYTQSHFDEERELRPRNKFTPRKICAKTTAHTLYAFAMKPKIAFREAGSVLVELNTCMTGCRSL